MNEKRFILNLLRTVIALSIVIFLGQGCGKKGMPSPPNTPPPSNVCGLSVEKVDGRARLAWSQAGCRPGGKVNGFNVYVYKEKADKPACANCPLMFEKTATVHVGRPNLWKTAPDKAVHIEPIENGFRHTYKVVAFGPGGESMDSDYVSVE